MLYLLVGYMFLFIHRPFEVWPRLGDLHVERVYILSVAALWLMYPRKSWRLNPSNIAILIFAAAVVLAWVLSPWTDGGQHAVEDWIKVLFFSVRMHDAVTAATKSR